MSARSVRQLLAGPVFCVSATRFYTTYATARNILTRYSLTSPPMKTTAQVTQISAIMWRWLRLSVLIRCMRSVSAIMIFWHKNKSPSDLVSLRGYEYIFTRSTTSRFFFFMFSSCSICSIVIHLNFLPFISKESCLCCLLK